MGMTIVWPCFHPPEIGSDKLEKKGRRRPLKTILQYKALEVAAAVVFLYRIAFVAQMGLSLIILKSFILYTSQKFSIQGRMY